MKTLKSLSILAAAAAIFATVSCTKEDTTSIEPEAKISTITLSIEQPTDESATKTQLGNWNDETKLYPIKWTKTDAHSDAIAVGTTSGDDVEEYTLSSVDAQDATKGTFSGTEVAGAVKAFYPYADVVSAAENVYNVYIPSVQTYTSATSFGEDAMPMYAVASSTDKLHSMKPLMSVLKITLRGSCTVKRIVISNASEKLSGRATVTYDGSSASLAFETDANDYVELVCPDGVALTSSGVVFHIVVPATAGDAPTKYTVRVVTNESKVMTKKFTPKSKFTAATIKNLTNVLAVSPGDNIQYVEGSYCGDAITVAEKTWAPVNCGYNSADTYGSFFQWGRKYGQNRTETLTPISMSKADDIEANKIKVGTNDGDDNWNSDGIDATLSLWNGSAKGSSDPCPAGWRVPTKDEFTALISLSKVWVAEGQKGYSFGTSPNQVFLPALGGRGGISGQVQRANEHCFYWTSTINNQSAYCYHDYQNYKPLDFYTPSGFKWGYSVRCVLE